jgi:hypothetical protein
MGLLALLFLTVAPVGAQEHLERSPVNGADLSFMPFQITSQRTEDRYQHDEGVLTVESSFGIGTVELRPKDGRWPHWRAVRFEYLERGGMKILEGFQLEGFKDGESIPISSCEPSLKNDALEVEIPPQLLEQADTVRIHWVDFYRS